MITMTTTLCGVVFIGCVHFFAVSSFHVNPNIIIQPTVKSSSSSLSRPCKLCNSVINGNAPKSRKVAALHIQMNEDGTSKERNVKDEVDSVSRRQLLLSMLVSAGATSSLMSNPALASDNVSIDDTIAEQLSIANSLRGDGNTKLIVPPMDNRIYETMTLENGLRVLLCSDPSSNNAAAAMDVHVGAASDPDSIPGLAHFCEVSLYILSSLFDKNSIQIIFVSDCLLHFVFLVAHAFLGY